MNDDTHLTSIIILDDDPDFRKLLLTILGKKFDGVDLVEYDPLIQGVPGDDFDWSKYDVLLLDYYLCIHGVTGLDILQNNRKNRMFPATIMLTGAGNEEVAVRALKAGVFEYLRKETLDKAHLHSTILSAFEKHKIKKEKLRELTNQGNAFNKALFYQELEQSDNDNRVLILIELDNHKILEERMGIIFRDNIIRHLARQSFEIFKLGECNPSITRFGDTSIALLIDAPGSRKTLEFNLQGLCNHLKKHPYKFDGKKIKTSVSLGVLCLSAVHLNAEEYIKIARVACNRAALEEGNSYHIHEVATQAPDREKEVVRETVVDKIPGPGETKAVQGEPVRDDEKKNAEQTGRIMEAPVSADTSTEKPAAVKQESNQTDDKYDPGLEKLELNEPLQNIKNAFDEKRTVQTFQPVISLTSEEVEREVYLVAVQLINKDGSIKTYDDIISETDIPVFRKFIDRWMLREILGRIIHRDNGQHLFIMKVSAASIADAGFFIWLRQMLTGLGDKVPGRQIALELSARHVPELRKQASALMNYLKKTHGFRFILGDTTDSQEVRKLLNNMDFDLIRTNFETISEMSQTYPTAGSPDKASILQHLKNNNVQFIVDNVRDATTLTESIGAGADYAAGVFIGDPTNQLDDVTSVETFEII